MGEKNMLFSLLEVRDKIPGKWELMISMLDMDMPIYYTYKK